MKKVFLTTLLAIGTLAALPAAATQIEVTGTCDSMTVACAFSFVGDPTSGTPGEDNIFRASEVDVWSADVTDLVTPPDHSGAGSSAAGDSLWGKLNSNREFGTFAFTTTGPRFVVDFLDFAGNIPGSGGGSFELLRRVVSGGVESFVSMGFGTYAVAPVAPVPLPAAAWLFITALAGAGVLGRRRSAVKVSAA